MVRIPGCSLHKVSFLSENIAKLFLFLHKYGIIKKHKSVIVSFPYEKEYTIADKEVCRMKAYTAGKLFWNTFKCESVLLRERCCISCS